MEEEINTLYNLLTKKQQEALKKYAMNMILSGIEPLSDTYLHHTKSSGIWLNASP